MRFRQMYILYLLLIFIPSRHSHACTAFCLQQQNNCVLAKNLDWPIGDGMVVVNPKNIQKFALVADGEISARWSVKFGSVTFNLFGKEFPLGGINEAGLVIEELNYSPSKYPPKDSLPSINEFQWIQYQLDCHHSVEQVIASLANLRISRWMFNLHYLIADKSGDVAVIEFIDGRPQIYRGDSLPVPILSNNSYPNSLKYLKLHAGFGGERVPTDGPESPERFVRAAILWKNFQPADRVPVSGYPFKMLHNVRQHDTQWSIVYDILGEKIVFKMQNFPAPRTIDLADFMFDRCSLLDLSSAGKTNFVDFSASANARLLETVFGKLVALAEVSDKDAARLTNELKGYLERLAVKKYGK